MDFFHSTINLLAGVELSIQRKTTVLLSLKFGSIRCLLSNVLKAGSFSRCATYILRLLYIGECIYNNNYNVLIDPDQTR